MSSNTSGRVLVAAALAAALCLSLAGPAEAAGERGISPGPLERLTAWFVGVWMADTASQTPPTEDDEDPEGCRGDYSACLDPNGIILPPNRPIGFP